VGEEIETLDAVVAGADLASEDVVDGALVLPTAEAHEVVAGLRVEAADPRGEVRQVHEARLGQDDVVADAVVISADLELEVVAELVEVAHLGGEDVLGAER